jgi:inner membrane protein
MGAIVAQAPVLLGLSASFDVQTVLFYAASVMVGSILPDIDETESYIGRRLFFISGPLSLFFKHRTFSHFFFVSVILILVGLNGYQNNEIYQASIFIGLSFGILTHDIGDMLTGGIRGFFFPFWVDSNISLLPHWLAIEVGSAVEYVMMIFFLFPANMWIAYQIYSQGAIHA